MHPNTKIRTGIILITTFFFSVSVGTKNFMPSSKGQRGNQVAPNPK